MKKKSLLEMLKAKYPAATVQSVADAPLYRDRLRVHSVAPLGQMKAKVGHQTITVDAIKVHPSRVALGGKSAKKGGPSGVAILSAKHADGYAAMRQNAKTVIVSHGKVIAVQG